jgi:hypothetical protein
VNKIMLSRTAFLLGLTATVALGSGLPVGAQMMDAEASDVKVQPEIEISDRTTVDPQDPEFDTTQLESSIEIPATITTSELTSQPLPIPGTSETSATTLLENNSELAQAELEPGRRTRSGSSYLGIGGNIGIGGETGIGNFGFAVFSKIGLTPRFSFRPGVVFSGDTDILLPITYDFPIQAEPFQRINIAPYIGAGVILTTNSDSNIGALLTGGFDLPLTDRFTATAGLNLGFNSDTVGVGVIIGVGYNFGEGFRF